MMLIDADKQVDEGYLADWYIHSICGGSPEWTEKHIEELCRDFVVIPREAAVAVFDEDKVFRELKAGEKVAHDDYIRQYDEFSAGMEAAYRIAIGVVERGGVR